MYRILLGTLLVLSLCACEVNLDDDEDNNDEGPEEVAGPCVQIEREPVVNLRSVFDIATNSGISQIEITNIKFEGNNITFEEDRNELTTNVYIEYETDTLLCTLPCAFFKREGSYEFTVRAANFEYAIVEFDASYSIFEGGCPSYVDGGTEFNIGLKKSVDIETND